MAKKSLIALSLLISFASVCNMGISLADQSQKTWCVAKPSSDVAVLNSNLYYVCVQVGLDCSIFQPGHPCFQPDNLVSHASVAMNIYYQAYGRNVWNCDFKNSAITVTTDPSYGSCIYA
ncbi:Carbohydrate-binding X8 domain superfamily protein [Striga hermonthica]|uniref:Carbohydrate-binding X8 domain superfamily protein n=1 Tax=Striga hermonthica TaxID=68872 RepID=A0A9N7MTQ4_STRHE|nr:Carbohydrate-binding X8 domain superfamily protein [Striga hermonthica]